MEDRMVFSLYFQNIFQYYKRYILSITIFIFVKNGNIKIIIERKREKTIFNSFFVIFDLIKIIFVFDFQ